MEIDDQIIGIKEGDHERMVWRAWKVKVALFAHYSAVYPERSRNLVHQFEEDDCEDSCESYHCCFEAQNRISVKVNAWYYELDKEKVSNKIHDLYK